jgi:hypothetical protein
MKTLLTTFATLTTLSLAALSLQACSSASSTATSTDGTTAADAAASAEATDAGPAPDAGPACAAPKKSGCGVDGSWITGVAHFDPAKVGNKVNAKLRVSLRHGFSLINGEERIGGRLHAYDSFKLDATKGEIAFSVDMCGLGTAMWSEENGPFHLVLFIDENGNNDLDNASSNQDAIVYATPDATELQKLVDVTVSCHSGAQCLDVNLDCTGASCLNITPITSCTKKTPSCKSADAFCK